MAMHQYIGARYVPYYYENSLDPTSTEWEPNVNYEALTVVTLPNRHSYISKKFVPDTIGSPALNAEYWLDTGSEDAYIQELQEAVQHIFEDLAPEFQSGTYNEGDFVIYEGDLYVFTSNHTGDWDPLDATQVSYAQVVQSILSDMATINSQFAPLSRVVNKRYVVISDSYGMGRGGQTPWTTPLQTMLGASNSDYFTFSEGSMGFYHTGEYGHNAKTLLESHSGDITDHDNITDIVFGLGLNDYADTTANIRSGLADLISYCQSEYPNASLWFGYIGNFLDKTTAELTNYKNSLYVIYEYVAGFPKCKIMGGIEYIMHMPSYFISDNVHPTTYGGNEIAKFAHEYLIGGHPIYRQSASYTIAGALSNFSCQMEVEGGLGTIVFGSANTSSAISTPSRALVEVGSIADAIIPVRVGRVFRIPATLYDSGRSTWVPGYICLSGGKVYVENIFGNNTNIPNNVQIYIADFSIDMINT